MASVDPGLLLGQLREEQAELRRRWVTGGVPDFFGMCFWGGFQPKKGKEGCGMAICDSPNKNIVVYN